MSYRITFLDGATVDYGDINLEPIKELGILNFFKNSSPDQVAERIKDATVVITNKVKISQSDFAQANNLKMIAKCATGYNDIDLKETVKRDICVTNVPGYSTESVAQQTVAFMLALTTNLIKYNTATHNKSWSNSGSFTMSDWPTYNLKEKTVAIMGMGAIGSAVAKLCEAFGMKIIALKRNSVTYNDAITRLPLNELAKVADFVTIHLPLSESTQYMINQEFISNMKHNAFLINMSRGAIVKEEHLYNALINKQIAGAALDVMEQEPPHVSNPLLGLDNIIITPHNSWGTKESRQKLIDEVAKNIKAFQEGESRNVVS